MKKAMMIAVYALLLIVVAGCNNADIKYRWQVHDMNRPQPTPVNPAQQPGGPPSDAIVLFDGKDLSQWTGPDGKQPGWKVEDGYMEIVPKSGCLYTKEPFGDCQLHIEWCCIDKPDGKGQNTGNSGVYFMNQYELQVLNSSGNTTYADGQAGALYGQYPPLVNVSLPANQWQSYDVVFRRPIFSDKGKLLTPATITVFQNGVVVQDSTVIWGATVHAKRATYAAHADKLPLMLQDHSELVRYRNIWIRLLAPKEPID